MNKCTKEMQNILTCLDLDTLFSLFCGERLGNGKLKLEHGEGSLQSRCRGLKPSYFQYTDIYYTLTIVHLKHAVQSNFLRMTPLMIIFLKYVFKFLILSTHLPVFFRYICSLRHIRQLTGLRSNDNEEV
jgi:hypothetical protein